ncbi:MAG: AsmA family protein [Planctomycetota bacterium]
MDDSVNQPTTTTPFPLPMGRKKPTKTRIRARMRRILLFVLIIPVLFAGVAFWIGSWVLSPEQMTYRAQALLADRLSTGFAIDGVKWKWPAGIEVNNLVIHPPHGSRYNELIRIARLDIALNPWAILIGKTNIERVEISGSTMVLERDHLGNLTILDVLRDAIAPVQGPALPSDVESRKTTAMSPPELIISDLRVETCPVTIAHSPEGLQVSSLRLEVSADDPELWKLDGVAFDSSVRSIRLEGGGRLSMGDFELNLDIDRILLDQNLRERIPPALRLVWDNYHPTGIASLKHTLVLRDAQPIKNSTELSISQGSLRFEEPDILVDQLSGKLEITPEAISFRDPLIGNFFGARALLHGEIKLEALKPGASELELEIDGLVFEPRIHDVLPEAIQKVWDNFSPSGKFGLRVSVGGEQYPPVIEQMRLVLAGVDGSYSRYPYPLRNLQGEIRYFDGKIELDITGGVPGEPVRARGNFQAQQLGEIHLVIEGQSLPLDDRVRTALGDRHSQIFDLYSPRGDSNLRIELERQVAGDPLDLRIVMDPTGASISHQAFPYRVHDLTGRVIFEISQGKVLFQNLVGRHGPSELSLPAGLIEYKDGQLVRMEIPIESPKLVPDEELISALPIDVANRLRSLDILRSNGSLDTIVELRSDENTPFDIYVRARVADPVRLRYHKLPYPLVFHQGQVVFSSTEGRIRLDELKTDPEISPIVTVSGEIGPDDSLETPSPTSDSTLLSMELTIMDGPDGKGLLLSDDELVQNLPPDLKNFFKKMQLDGSVTGRIGVVYRYLKNELTEPIEIVEYDVQGKLEQGGFDFAIRAEEVSANFVIHGGIQPGQGHTFSGQLSDGDFRFSRFHTIVPSSRNLSFTYGIEHPRLAFGDDQDQREGSPSQWLTSRLPVDRSNLFQAELGPCEIYGGPLDGFFFADLGHEHGGFAGEASLSNINLALGSELLFRKKGVRGTAQGEVRVEGLVGSPDSIIGGGEFSIREGSLAQIPLLAGAIINPFEGLNRSNNKVREADCKFSIHDQIFDFKGMGSIKLRSNTGRILGRGTVTFNKILNLVMEPQTLGGAPLLSDIANRLLRFRIRGTLDDPELNSRKAKPSQDD